MCVFLVVCLCVARQMFLASERAVTLFALETVGAGLHLVGGCQHCDSRLRDGTKA